MKTVAFSIDVEFATANSVNGQQLQDAVVQTMLQSLAFADSGLLSITGTTPSEQRVAAALEPMIRIPLLMDPTILMGPVEVRTPDADATLSDHCPILDDEGVTL